MYNVLYVSISMNASSDSSDYSSDSSSDSSSDDSDDSDISSCICYFSSCSSHSLGFRQSLSGTVDDRLRHESELYNYPPLSLDPPCWCIAHVCFSYIAQANSDLCVTDLDVGHSIVEMWKRRNLSLTSHVAISNSEITMSANFLRLMSFCSLGPN